MAETIASVVMVVFFIVLLGLGLWQFVGLIRDYRALQRFEKIFERHCKDPRNR